jgi:hypothetical protein
MPNLGEVTQYAKSIRVALSGCTTAICNESRPTLDEIDYLPANANALATGLGQQLLPAIEATAKAYVELMMAIDFEWPLQSGHRGVSGHLPQSIGTARTSLFNAICHLEQQLEIAEAGSIDHERLIRFSEAEQLTGVNKGTIKRAADAGKIVDNGKDGDARRVDIVSVHKWNKERANGEDL